MLPQACLWLECSAFILTKPARYRGGYNLLTKEQQQAADAAALELINEWMVLKGYQQYDQETIKSKTEANLYWCKQNSTLTLMY